MKSENEKNAAEAQTLRPLARFTAREVTAEELAKIAGGAATGSRWPSQPPGTDADKEF